MPELLKPYLNNVMLIEPPNGIYPGFQNLIRTEPLGLEYVAGAICPLDPNQKQFVENVSIHDDRVKPGGWKEEMRKNPPDIIGIRLSYTADVPIVHQLLKEIRREVGKDIPIIVGGHHVSHRPSDVFIDEVDAVVIGSGEKPMQELVESWSKFHSFKAARNVWYKDEGGDWHSNVDPVKFSPLFELESCLMNERPMPRRDLVEQYRKMGRGYFFLYYPNIASMEMGRGCLGRCKFCSVWKFHNGEYRVQSTSRTIMEMAALPDDIKYILFVDDLAFFPRLQKDPRTGRMEWYDPGVQLADGMTERGLQDRFRMWSQIRADSAYPRIASRRKSAEEKYNRLAQVGLDMTLVGVESFVKQQDLTDQNKGISLDTNTNAVKVLHRAGIRVWAAQIVPPGWDEADYESAIEANNALKIAAPQFTRLTHLPGSDNYVEAFPRITSFYPGRYNFFHWVEKTKLPPEETDRQQERLYKETGRSLTSIKVLGREFAEGLTTPAWARDFYGYFKDGMYNSQNGNAHAEDMDVERAWRQFLAMQAVKYGGPESILLEQAS